MDNFLTLLRLALERGWTLGLLFLIFFGAALLAPSHGVPFPEILSRSWVNAGFFFGLAVFVVSILNHFLEFVRGIVSNWQEAAEVRREEEREAARNFQLLTDTEKSVLIDLLRSNRTRFEVQIVDPSYELFRKGILVEVARSGASGWFCDLRAGILANKQKILRGRL